MRASPPLRGEDPVPARAVALPSSWGSGAAAWETAGESGLTPVPGCGHHAFEPRPKDCRSEAGLSVQMSGGTEEPAHISFQARSPCGPAFLSLLSSFCPWVLRTSSTRRLLCAVTSDFVSCCFSGLVATVLLQTPLPRAWWGSGDRHLLRTP